MFYKKLRQNNFQKKFTTIIGAAKNTPRVPAHSLFSTSLVLVAAVENRLVRELLRVHQHKPPMEMFQSTELDNTS